MTAIARKLLSADLFKILDEEKFRRILLHCFSGTLKEVEEGWSRGYFVGFTGIVTYPKAETLREIAKKCPENKLMIETDCPYLAPQSHRGKRNEPAFITEVAHYIANLREIPVEQLEKILGKNAKEFFGI